MKSECLRYLKEIFKAKKDEACPTRPGEMVIEILASQDGFKLKTKLGVKEYDSVIDVFDALFNVELRHYEGDEHEAMWSLYRDLNHISP